VSKNLTVTFTDEEHAKLKKIADALQLTMADVLVLAAQRPLKVDLPEDRRAWLMERKRQVSAERNLSAPRSNAGRQVSQVSTEQLRADVAFLLKRLGRRSPTSEIKDLLKLTTTDSRVLPILNGNPQLFRAVQAPTNNELRGKLQQYLGNSGRQPRWYKYIGPESDGDLIELVGEPRTEAQLEAAERPSTPARLPRIGEKLEVDYVETKEERAARLEALVAGRSQNMFATKTEVDEIFKHKASVLEIDFGLMEEE